MSARAGLSSFLFLVLVLAGAPLGGQPTYSIDFQSPTIGVPDAGAGIPITEGDILTPTGVVGAPPAIAISGGFAPPGLGLPAHPAAIGHPPGVPGLVEVDALSYGTDILDDPAPPLFIPRQWIFSVDEFAVGLQPPPPLPPNVSTEGAVLFPAPPPPGQEASADIFGYFPPGAFPPGIAPVPPFAAPPGNLDIIDGDGLGPIGPFSLGLVEPNIPVPGPFDVGDNLDAVDVDHAVPIIGVGFPVYFSLDSGLVFDLIDGFPGTASAPANGPFVGGDVLVTGVPGAPPGVYAPAFLLGLDLIGPDTDDLDALILHENGDGVFTPSAAPYDWLGGGTDMLFFSVRRGSAVIGVPDFFFGIPIGEGDILTPAGPPGTPPGIWVAAENLGLCTQRPGMPPGGLCPVQAWGPFSDDLNALDLAHDCNDDGIPDALSILLGLQLDCNANGLPDDCEIAFGLAPDCNTNGIPDACDIASGFSMDVNGNMVPDECEDLFKRGDCNRDNLFSLLDPIFLLNFLFIPGSPAPTCEDACDSDDNGLLSLVDVIYELNFLFVPGSPPPPPPHPGCGPDPTPDPLRCAAYPHCP